MNQDELIEKISAMSTKMEGQEKDIKNLYKKYDEIAKTSNASNIDVQKILVKIENMDENTKKDINEMKEMLSELASKPSKNWDKLTTGFISAIIGGLVTFLFVKLGLK